MKEYYIKSAVYHVFAAWTWRMEFQECTDAYVNGHVLRQWEKHWDWAASDFVKGCK